MDVEDLMFVLYTDHPYEIEPIDGQWGVSFNFLHESGQEWVTYFVTGDPEILMSRNIEDAYLWKRKWLARAWAWYWNRAWRQANRA